MNELVGLWPFAAVLLIFWLLLIRPASRRQKEVRALQAGLKAGDRVILTSGIFGVVTSVADERVGVRIADGVEVEVVRGAVGAVEQEDAATPAPTEEPEARDE